MRLLPGRWNMHKHPKRNLARAVGVAISLLVFFVSTPLARAQSPALPDAPRVQLIASLPQDASPQTQAPAADTQTSQVAPTLTLAQAEQIAIKNNPNISIARLLALAQVQVTREVRSAELP